MTVTTNSKKSKLKKIGEEAMSIARKRHGRGFRYFDESGKPISNKKLLKRLKSLIIPPMWSDVHICKWEDGHVQATGRDLKGRKQYIYHTEWERQRQEKKFHKMAEFGTALPFIRKENLNRLKRKKWDYKKVVALVVTILDETGIRIGNKQYAKRNGTYGLSTLRRKHMQLEKDILKFEYKGKSNKEREVEIDDPDLIKLIRSAAKLPGYELFRYRSGAQEYEAIDSDDINSYIRSVIGDQYSSKDFRTWTASRLALELYPDAIKIKEEAPRKKFANILLRMVADELGNTPSICKSHYVHPLIMRGIEDQELPNANRYKDSRSAHGLSAAEKAVMKVIG